MKQQHFLGGSEGLPGQSPTMLLQPAKCHQDPIVMLLPPDKCHQDPPQQCPNKRLKTIDWSNLVCCLESCTMSKVSKQASKKRQEQGLWLLQVSNNAPDEPLPPARNKGLSSLLIHLAPDDTHVT